MSEKLKHTSFDELIERGVLEIGDGYRAKLTELGGTGPIFLRAGKVSDAGIEWSGTERFNVAWIDRVASKLGRPGDTVVTTKGNSVGRTGYVQAGSPKFVYSPHLSYWRSGDDQKLDPGFLRYWAKGPEFVHQLRALAYGTDMAPYLSLVDQRRMHISLPPIADQQAIAEVLGALDDKIDAIGIAQGLADNLFKRWRLGLAAVEPVTFSELADVYGGSTPKTNIADYWGGDVAWAVPRDVTALSNPYLFDTERHITHSGLGSIGNRLHPAGTIFMTSRATIGAFAVVQRPCAAIRASSSSCRANVS